jgi:hypothetical protein
VGGFEFEVGESGLEQTQDVEMIDKKRKAFFTTDSTAQSACGVVDAETSVRLKCRATPSRHQLWVEKSIIDALFKVVIKFCGAQMDVDALARSELISRAPFPAPFRPEPNPD